PEILPVERSERLPLSYAQQRLWLLDKLQPGSRMYNVHVSYRLHGRLHREALEWSLREIGRRHETLRTHLVTEALSAWQVIGSGEAFSVKHVGLKEVPGGAREKLLEDFLADEVSRPFNLAEEAAFRATLVELGEQDHVLALVMHHILTDEWSMRL